MSRKTINAIANQPVALATTAVPIDLAGPLVASDTTGTRIAGSARSASRTSITENACQAVRSGGPNGWRSPTAGGRLVPPYHVRDSETSSTRPPRPAMGSARRIALGRGHRRFEGVAQEHRDRHRADAAGHGRDQRRALDGGFELYVAGELLGRAVHAHVDHHGAFLDPVALDHLRHADR